VFPVISSTLHTVLCWYRFLLTWLAAELCEACILEVLVRALNAVQEQLTAAPDSISLTYLRNSTAAKGKRRGLIACSTLQLTVLCVCLHVQRACVECVHYTAAKQSLIPRLVWLSFVQEQLTAHGRQTIPRCCVCCTLVYCSYTA
jgi:hypothetical protein